MALSKYEMEVSISFNALDDTADLYTSNPAWITKMDKLVAANPEQFKVIQVARCKERIVSKRYKFPKRFVSIRSKDVKLEISEERRAEMSAAAKERFGRKE